MGNTKGGTFSAEPAVRQCGDPVSYTHLDVYKRQGVFTQIKRDTNFATPGYSLFCHDTTASGKNKVFSVCGHSCGQSRFYAVFNDWGKSHKCRCHKAFRRFALLRPGYRHGTPKELKKSFLYNFGLFSDVSALVYLLSVTL